MTNLIFLIHTDDIPAVFNNEQDLLNFLDSVNKKHSNIKFTIEKQLNHSITFLDVLILGIKVNKSVYIENGTYEFC